jgi:chromosomal replication initiator protein
VTVSSRAPVRAPAIHLELDHRVWLDTLARLRTTHPDICRHWFEDIEPLGLDNGVLRLRAHSAHQRDYLHRNCMTQFTEAAQVASGNLISIRFLGPDEDFPTKPAPAAQPAAAAAAGAGALRLTEPAVDSALTRAALETLRSPGLVLNPDYTFDHFVIGPENRMAHHAAMCVADKPGMVYTPLFVHGSVGLGKTHLLQAICLHIQQAKPDASIYYTSCEDFSDQYFGAMRGDAMSHFRQKFRHVDVLVIDDIHTLRKLDRLQEEFFHTFNALYQSRKQIVLSADCPPEDIPHLEARLVSRFMSGLVCDVQAPSYETRVEILRVKARLRGFDLAADVARFVAERVDGSIRELEGAISRLQMRASVEQRPIDLDLARTAFNDHAAKVEPKIQIQTIIDAVTEYYGVKVSDLQSKRRQRSIALPRQVCMYLARKNTRYSLEEIGGYFGGRDHTTVMHAVRTVEDRRTSDSEFGKVVAALEERLRGPVA